MNDDGVSSPPPDDFAEAPRTSFAERAAGTAASVPPTARRAPKRKPAAKKKAGKGKKKGPAAKKRPAAKKSAGKKKGAKGGRKKR